MNLFDSHADLFRSTFTGALPWERYISTGSDSQTKKWTQFYESLVLTSGQSRLIASFTRKMNLLVLSGIWCGDCMRQCPQVQTIADGSEKIDLRFAELDPEAPLSKELRLHGAPRVPMVVILSEDFFEVARFGDRPLSAYRRKAARELGAACEIGVAPGSGDTELAEELAEWMDFIERGQLILRTSPFLRARYGD